MDESTNREKRANFGYVGWAAYGLFAVGTGAGLVAIVALFHGPEPNFTGAGVCLIASALGFGLLLNGMLRR